MRLRRWLFLICRWSKRRRGRKEFVEGDRRGGLGWLDLGVLWRGYKFGGGLVSVKVFVYFTCGGVD